MPVKRSRRKSLKRTRSKTNGDSAFDGTRDKVDAVIRLLNEFSESVRRELETQFKRIAQMQLEIDDLKRASGSRTAVEVTQSESR